MLIENERWEVVGEGNYAISNHGRLMRTTANRKAIFGGNAKPGQLLKLTKDSRGHPHGSFIIDGKTTHHSVSRLVAESFLGPRPHGKMIGHKDNNPSNNHWENLYYKTRAIPEACKKAAQERRNRLSTVK